MVQIEGRDLSGGSGYRMWGWMERAGSGIWAWIGGVRGGMGTLVGCRWDVGGTSVGCRWDVGGTSVEHRWNIDGMSCTEKGRDRGYDGDVDRGKVQEIWGLEGVGGVGDKSIREILYRTPSDLFCLCFFFRVFLFSVLVRGRCGNRKSLVY